MTSRKLLVIAIILSLITAGSVFYYLYNLEQSLDDQEYVEVLVAAGEISENTRVTGSMLEEKRIPVEYVHGSAVLEPANAIGNITKVPLAAGEVILRSHLAETDETEDGLSYTIPEGMRAVSFAVTEISGISNLILPGDRVDVIATMDFSEGNITQTGYVLQNKLVLSTGSELDRNPSTERIYSTVTLAATPQEALNLILASERGSIRVLMRSPVDERILDIPSLRLTDMLEGR